MGNCFIKSRKSTAEIVPQDVPRARRSVAPTVKLYGSSNSFFTAYIRFALLHKAVSLRFVPSETPNFGYEGPVIQVGSETVSGSRETLLHYIEARFPHPPLVIPSGDEEATPPIVRAVGLHHRSITWHVERLVRWAADLEARRGKGSVDPGMGSPRMEVRKFAKSYSELLDVMLEHAQMEEKVLFPILEMADRGLCKAAHGEHARDLPIMNGIKEDIKSIGVMDSGSPAYQEALFNLSTRLRSLLEHCKQHFLEEDMHLLPLMEAVELSKEQQRRILKQGLDVMQATHSHLFNFLLEGLLPHEAMEYLDLIASCKENSLHALLRLKVD
ncbi:hypothetical protein I3843_13G034000 [Carya illinoinensis]|uniref:Hemerythrin-like domain-containing protein n=1 Tax=Carya illinoinensis TaxID=32201 RepID=A0A8T1NM55_CARIL|nr:uncharacterized protein LOC122291868 [Carya illinoinensis]KAG2672420.1 hypothetical protein I3760_13G040100 [Carya illinoinensis]KAG6630742.1 hypothetical protein CIPAW_13G040700 [Carya illinoinensis]KAG7948929.1 hypothetical protein I3843_13G034000 [Carya illinoinensis]